MTRIMSRSENNCSSCCPKFSLSYHYCSLVDFICLNKYTTVYVFVCRTTHFFLSFSKFTHSNTEKKRKRSLIRLKNSCSESTITSSSSAAAVIITIVICDGKRRLSKSERTTKRKTLNDALQ